MSRCEQQAVVRYTWPGEDEACACLEHAQQLAGVARAMGLYIQLIPLSGEEQAAAICAQQLRGALGGAQ